MKLLTFDMEITGVEDGYFVHSVEHHGQKAEFRFNPENADLSIPHNGMVSSLLSNNKHQLLKVLKTKKLNSYYPGFCLRFVLTDGKDVGIFNDMSKIILVDRRKSEDEIDVLDSGKQFIHKVFTDASYFEETGRSGIAAVIKYPDDSYKLFSLGGQASNNCHAELEAVVAGLELLKDVNEIRLISDSRYVRKGLTEWIYNWRLNDWKTSNGKRAKNIDCWQKIDKLTRGKYLEVAWIKGHSGHFENTMCDLYARDAAEKSKNIPD